MTNFLEQLHKRGIEKILEGELDTHLDYDKHKKSKAKNFRNGYTQKKVKNDFRRDRNKGSKGLRKFF
ncbi:transposase [Lutibacter sp. A64]|nr:transposase [Lutibacter sp. A64]UMB55524.1 transposase [Lutibacter sp. A64]